MTYPREQSVAVHDIRVDIAAIAQTHETSTTRTGRPLAYLTNESYFGEELNESHQYFVERAKEDFSLPLAAEWLLDNFYIVQQAVAQIKEDMPPSFYEKLPVLTQTSFAGYPRVFAIAHALLERAEASLDIKQIQAFLNAYQEVCVLAMGEIWALPAILRILSLENLTWAVCEVANTPLKESGYALPIAPSTLENDTIVANAINNLRMLSSQNWKVFFESVSRVEAILRHDPLAIYPHMDFQTRNCYREKIEMYTDMDGERETVIAQTALDMASNYEGDIIQATHVGYYLIGDGQASLETKIGYQPPLIKRIKQRVKKHNLSLYLTTILLLTGVMFIIILQAIEPLSFWEILGLSLILVWSISAVAIDLVNNILTLVTAPAFLPRLDHTDEAVELPSTAVVIPALLSDEEEVDSLTHQLEQHFLRNAGDHIHFVILADYADAEQKVMPQDEALWNYARDAIQALNERYQTVGRMPFYILLRERLWNESEQIWMAWERKRGKLAQFNRFLLNRYDGENPFIKTQGNLEQLQNIKYVITLDADTLLPPDSANCLIATMIHPLNQPQYNADKSRVINGYAIMQPRVEIIPQAATQTMFTRIFAGDTTLDLYTLAVSDVYQDIFDEGIYVGKGIYDVQAFEDVLHDRVPENRLLSHDLFESNYARTALVTDIVVLEDYPPHFLAYMMRVHRWIRGDWQLLPFLFDSHSQLSGLGTWKIVDNLRRSLVAPSLLFLLITGWTILPGSPLLWTMIATLISGFPFLISTINQLLSITEESNWDSVFNRFANAATRWFLSLMFLPHTALINIDAIVTSLYRLVTKKHLLQWVTASHTTRLFGSEVRMTSVYGHMQTTIFLVIITIASVLLMRPSAIWVTLPFLVIWSFSLPLVSYLSQAQVKEATPLTDDDKRKLRRIARHTWLFFEQYVKPDNNWLPPDHYQEAPREITAYHTSPTNMGLFLVCVLAAYDFGYIGLSDLLIRLQLSLQSMNQLEKYRGHLLNWYDIRRLVTLPPRYVSTVDSGNLVGFLIALQMGLNDVQKQPLIGLQRWSGFADTLDLLIELITSSQFDVSTQETHHLKNQLVTLRDSIEHDETAFLSRGQRYQKKWQEIYLSVTALLDTDQRLWDSRLAHEFSIYVDRIQHHLHNIERDTDLFLSWQSVMEDAPTQVLLHNPDTRTIWTQLQDLLHSIPNLEDASRIFLQALKLNTQLRHHLHGDSDVQWSDDLALALQTTLERVEEALRDCRHVQQIIDDFISGMDFRFLFNDERKIFHIGYNLETQQLDNSYYDLLASEARIASLVAIATKQIPQDHWLHLSRPIISHAGHTVLMSWSGTMFEYLMPRLLMRSYDDSLIDFAYDSAVRYQIAYAEQHQVPWGISESGYYTFDSNMKYQYRAFGVPTLAFKRGMGNDIVISPYASFLALPINPQAVIENSERLDAAGGYSVYGYYEALDYTGSRLPIGQDHMIVKEYMAHHQGMIFVALLNYLHNDTMVERFHTNPYIESVELLLQERLPGQYQEIENRADDIQIQRTEASEFNTNPWQPEITAPVPQVHSLSNGQYSLLITSTGGGYSEWNNIALTRWYADMTQEDYGTWIYFKDYDNNAIWSIGKQPIASDDHRVWFDPYQAVFRTEAHGIVAQMSITVAYDDDVEIRRVRLTNQTDEERSLHYTSYAEVVLAAQMSDHRHPAFSKLFIETEYLPEVDALLFYRRKRSPHDAQPFVLHMLFDDSEAVVQVESDRRDFIGRNGNYRYPKALHLRNKTVDGISDITIDPILALGKDVKLAPHESIEFAYITMAGNQQADLVSLANKYRSWSTIDYTFIKARYQSELELQRIEVDSTLLQNFQKLLSALLYPQPDLRADSETLAKNTLGQSGLWKYGISGDYPICLVKLGDEEDIALVQELLKAHLYWRKHNIAVTLVILNQRDTGYTQELYNKVQRLVRRMNSDTWLDRHDGIFILRADLMDEAARYLLAASARVYLDASDGTLAQQLQSKQTEPIYLPTLTPSASKDNKENSAPELQRPDNLLFDNEFGGFDTRTGEYVIYRTPDTIPPAPWTNVIANPDFGFSITESGGGFTWAVNSSENRLTAWRNDPVEDMPSEIIYVRDEETGNIWTTTPLPASKDIPFLIKHGKGYSTFQNVQHGIEITQSMYVDPNDPVKIIRLECVNHWKHTRRITLTYYAEWVLGTLRGITQQYIIPEYDAGNRSILAHNPYSIDFNQSYMLISASQDFHGFTTDRREFLGRLNNYHEPSALRRVGLGSQVNAGDDTCAAVQLHINLEPETSKTVYFIVGGGIERDEALRLSKKYQDDAEAQRAWDESRTFWEKTVQSIEVETPEPSMDVLLPWLLYQALSCRIWGRSALYQSGGAFGFRDQLQDVLSIIHVHPHIAREHILRAARHQFEEGDVLHWWHPPSDRGVRTHFSDDLIWLPFVTAYYVKSTGDISILYEEEPFLQGDPLKPDEDDRYGYYESGNETFTLYEHCRRALERGTNYGRHGLPLMGSGDWNDGMSRVGVHGKGESIWVAWFLCATMQAFIPVSEIMNDTEQIAQYQARIEKYQQALEDHAWDGAWYRRAYYDDGTPLGSASNDECQIDSLAQSWGVISGIANPERANIAMQSLLKYLYKPEEDLLLLFTPPFDETEKDPGYIKGYPPGVRENGGQYTHAAIWTVWALAEMGEGNQAEALFRLLNPILHSESRAEAESYRVEPYVIAADVYSVAPYIGMGGWTWYTGSSGWMYRLGIEAILGIEREGNVLIINPTIPKQWKTYNITYRFKQSTYKIEVQNPEGVCEGVVKVTVDGDLRPNKQIPLLDEKETYQIVVMLGKR